MLSLLFFIFARAADNGSVTRQKYPGMGKGDIKTKRGKRHIGSYGRHRLRKKKRTPLKAAAGKGKKD